MLLPVFVDQDRIHILPSTRIFLYPAARNILSLIQDGRKLLYQIFFKIPVICRLDKANKKSVSFKLFLSDVSCSAMRKVIVMASVFTWIDVDNLRYPLTK